MHRSGWLLAFLPLVAACDVISGLDDFGVSGAGGAAGGGGAAGMAGAGGENGGGAGGDGGSVMMGRACAFQDAFEAPDLGPLWEPSVLGGPTIETGGELVFVVPGGNGKLAASVQTEPLDAERCQVSIHYLGEALEVGTFAHFEFFIDENNRAGFLLVDSELRYHHEVASQKEYSSAVFDPGSHAFWRIARDSGLFTWSVSGDGTTWTVVHTIASALPANALRVIMGTEVLPDTIDAASYEVHFDDVAATSP